MAAVHRDAPTEPLLRQIEARTNHAIAAGRDVTSLGAFLAALHPTNDLVWLNFVVPNSDRVDQLRPEHIDELRDLFRSRGRRLRFEYFESLWPGLAAVLEAHGMQFEGRMPLMLCSPDAFRPVTAPDVRVLELSADDEDPVIAEFLVTGKRGFGIEQATVEPHEVAEQRQHLRNGVYRCAYGLLGGRMVGIGSLAQANDELAGITSLSDARRRGVAASVSSHLVARHFASGQPHVWLSTGDDVARAVYEKIGFQAAGVQLTYVDPY